MTEIPLEKRILETWKQFLVDGGEIKSNWPHEPPVMQHIFPKDDDVVIDTADYVEIKTVSGDTLRLWKSMAAFTAFRVVPDEPVIVEAK